MRKTIYFVFAFLTFIPSTVLTEPVYYFASKSCGKCNTYFAWLKSLENRDPKILFYKIDPFSASGREKYQLLWNSLTNSDSRDYFKFPALFVGDTLLTGNIRDDSLIFHFFYNRKTEDADIAERKERSLHILSVAFLGLADGVNPCAFAALVFLISFLTVKGRKKATVLLSALFFSAGIFFFYFIFGWAAAVFLARNFSFYPLVAKAVKTGIVVFCFISALLQLLDVFKPRGKKSSLSEGTIKKIHGILRINKNVLFFMFFFAGTAVSFSELLCTGQIYIPTIVMISQISWKSLVLLFIYNLMFIAPLLGIITIYAVTSDLAPIQRTVQKNIKILKLFMAIVLFALGFAVLFEVLV